MSPFTGGTQFGPEERVASSAMLATAERMFADGADEVRVRKLRGAGVTRPARKAVDRRRKRKAQKRARRATRARA